MTSPEQLIRPEILNMPAYPVASAQDLIKLDIMENPYELPEETQFELGQHLSRLALNRYPVAGNYPLRLKMRTALQIPQELELMLGNGSDELIHLIIQACAREGTCVMAPVPSFVMYAMSAQLNRLPFVGVPLQTDFSIDMPAMLSALKQHKPSVLFLAYPNNPTGNLWPEDQIAQLIKASPGLVVIDEAYQPFAETSWLPHLLEAPNVVLIRTLSKLGLAGIRLGYLIGSPQWLKHLDKVRPPFNINVLTQATAEFMMDRLALLDWQAAILREQRIILFKALSHLPGVIPFESHSNFILVRVPNAVAWFEGLKTRGILVKNVSNMHPTLLANCLRLTVGTPEQTALLIYALQELAR
ncbi:MAG: histidinol-phosphate transaminase [Burkholderiaceae bacterium]|nr:histidinol-phosphate transaminase [Burkholderiaceae bacterium]